MAGTHVELLTMRPLRPGDKPRTCQVGAHAGSPDDCTEPAAYELRVLDGVSWACAGHAMKVKAELDRGAPCSIKAPRGEN